jgi:hypothetical protein
MLSLYLLTLIVLFSLGSRLCVHVSEFVRVHMKRTHICSWSDVIFVEKDESFRISAELLDLYFHGLLQSPIDCRDCTLKQVKTTAFQITIYLPFTTFVHYFTPGEIVTVVYRGFPQYLRRLSPSYCVIGHASFRNTRIGLTPAHPTITHILCYIISAVDTAL